MQVEQIDIDAVNAFQARSFEALFRSTGPAKRPINEAHRLLAEAFARHRRQARAEQAAELAKFKALAETLAGALGEMQSYGCPVCNGDCGSANPPVMSCPMSQCAEALREYKEARDEFYQS